MKAEGTNPERDIQASFDGKVTPDSKVDSLSSSITDSSESPAPKGWRRFLVPGIIGLLLLGGIGWIVLNRVILPMMFAGQGQFGPMPVGLANPKSATIADSSDYAASLDSRQSVTLQPRVSGQIAAIYAKPGERVEAGTPLLQIDAAEQRAQVASRAAAAESAVTDIESAQADVANARDTLRSLQARRASSLADLQLNQSEYERYQALYREGASSQQVLDQRLNALRTAQANLSQVDAEIRAQQSVIARSQSTVARNQRSLQQAQANVAADAAQLRYYSITAPFTGIVGDIPVKVGDFVSTTTPLLRVTQNQQLEVQIGIPLERSGDLKPGQTVQLLNERDQVLQSGKISFIAPNVDPTTQSVQVKAVFDNPGGKLRTAQFVRARVIWNQKPGVLIPTTAISRLAGKDFVFVATPLQNSKCQADAQKAGAASGGANKMPPDQLVADQRQVTLGKIIGNDQEVQEGLTLRDRIVVSGILNLQNCMPIMDSATLPQS